MQRVLAVVDGAMWGGLIFPDRLPDIATALLVEGADSPELRNLAGLDLEPFDPRDAQEAFVRLLDEQSIPPGSIATRVSFAAHLLAVAANSHVLGLRNALHRFARLAIAADYPDDPEIMRLYGLEDEWAGEWGRTHPDIEQELKEIFSAMATRAQSPPGYLVKALVESA